MFWKRKGQTTPLPKAAVCYVEPAKSRAAADWLNGLGLCKSVAILSDDPQDALWTCRQAKPDILVLEAMPDAMERLDDPNKDITGRCELSIRVKELLPDCRVYLVCGEEFRRLEPVMQKAISTRLIDGCRFGALDRQCVQQWLARKSDTPNRREETKR